IEADAIVSQLEQEAQSVGALSPDPVDATEKRAYAADAAPFDPAAIRVGVYGRRAVMLFLGFCYTLVSNIFSTALHIFQAENFPTRMRATAAGSTYGLSRLSAAAMPFMLLPVLRDSGPDAMFAAIGIAMAIAVASVGLFGPATAGRSLEEINARSSN